MSGPADNGNPILSLLPREVVPATQLYPRTMLIVSEFKVGKSSVAAWVSRNRAAHWWDYEEEEASDFLPGVKTNVPARVRELNAQPDSEGFKAVAERVEGGRRVTKLGFCLKLWEELAAEWRRTGVPRYDYMLHDKIDTLQDWAERWATVRYANSVIGKNFAGETVLDLEDGAGHLYLRRRFLEIWNAIMMAAPVHIFMASLKTNRKVDKAGNVYNQANVDLFAGVRKIAGGRCDAPCLMYRMEDGTNWLSFKTSDPRAFTGARGALEGQEFEFSRKGEDGELRVAWGRIFPEVEVEGPGGVKVKRLVRRKV